MTSITEFMVYALERAIAYQEAFADRLDRTNPDDPYASLMIRDDIDTLRELLEAAKSLVKL